MKYAYYPGCSLDSTAIEYGISTRRLAEKLGDELQEIPDFNCCGASSAHNTDKLLALALPARNLAIAEEMDMDVLVPCAACYSRFRSVEHAVRKDPEVKAKVQTAIDRKYEAKHQSLSVLEWLHREVGVKAVADKVTNPLKGLKAACYYGCLLVRPPEITGFDDPENPVSMDEIVKALGARTVDWSFKTECCGAGLASTRPEIGRKMIHDILNDAKAAGADCIVTACPLCQMNLDMRQGQVEKSFGVKFDMPVYYVTELAALAMGDSYRDLGIDRHFVESVKLLEEIKTRPEEDAKAKPAKTQPAARSTKAGEGAQEGTGAQSPNLKLAQDILGETDAAVKLAGLLDEDELKVQKLVELKEKDITKAEKLAAAYLKKAGAEGEEGSGK